MTASSRTLTQADPERLRLIKSRLHFQRSGKMSPLAKPTRMVSGDTRCIVIAILPGGIWRRSCCHEYPPSDEHNNRSSSSTQTCGVGCDKTWIALTAVEMRLS